MENRVRAMTMTAAVTAAPTTPAAALLNAGWCSFAACEANAAVAALSHVPHPRSCELAQTTHHCAVVFTAAPYKVQISSGSRFRRNNSTGTHLELRREHRKRNISCLAEHIVGSEYVGCAVLEDHPNHRIARCAPRTDFVNHGSGVFD